MSSVSQGKKVHQKASLTDYIISTSPVSPWFMAKECVTFLTKQTEKCFNGQWKNSLQKIFFLVFRKSYHYLSQCKAYERHTQICITETNSTGGWRQFHVWRARTWSQTADHSNYLRSSSVNQAYWGYVCFQSSSSFPGRDDTFPTGACASLSSDFQVRVTGRRLCHLILRVKMNLTFSPPKLKKEFLEKNDFLWIILYVRFLFVQNKKSCIMNNNLGSAGRLEAIIPLQKYPQ